MALKSVYSYEIRKGRLPGQRGDSSLKQHRFWAWGAVICMVMVMITGYRHK